MNSVSKTMRWSSDLSFYSPWPGVEKLAETESIQENFGQPAPFFYTEKGLRSNWRTKSKLVA